ncbi:hypothetical protein D2Q93_06890 [Alicyclobacillaceae bacterium I2511]|nr:hypothetical protein D2Q93_06890 [Alicyclobacillaceae bacterium I2511]
MNRLLNNNLVLRVIALVLSIIIWLTVNSQGAGNAGVSGVSTPFVNPVQVTVGNNMVVTGIAPSRVTLTVTSPAIDMGTLPAQMMNVVVSVDARGLAPGTHQLPVQVRNMPPFHFTVDPSAVTVQVDEKVSSVKPVQVRVTGSPAQGHPLGTASSDLTSVQVTGAQSLVNQVTAVIATVSSNGLTKTTNKVASLIPVNAQGQTVGDVSVVPNSVTVTIPIDPPQITLPLQPQLSGTPAPGFAVSGLTVSPQKVSVSGSTQVLAGLTSIPAGISVSGLRNSQTFHLTLLQPKGVKSLRPSQATVQVQVQPSASKIITQVPVQLIQTPLGLQVSILNPKTVSVSVTGPASVVNQLTAQNLTAQVNASKLAVASTSAPIIFTVPSWVIVTQTSANSAAIQVTGTVGR